MPADIPIACTLSEPELRERETTVLKSFGAQIRHVEALPDGYSIEVAANEKGLAAAVALIQAERLCCPFLRFDLTVEAGRGPVRLALTGAPGVKEFLATWLEPRVNRTS
jgi:hypothetical protein